MAEQLLLEILLNPSVKDVDVERLSKQSIAIFNCFKRGPVKTSLAASIARQYNARINELRHALVKVGLMIDKQEGEGGENTYVIVPLDVSTFWQKVKRKGQEWKWLKGD